MNLRFTRSEEAFREEIREFLRDELPPDWEIRDVGNLGESAEDSWEYLRTLQRKLAGKRWLTMAWPEEYGGQSAGIMTQLIYNEEMAYARVPTQVGMGPDRIGPTIILYGTDEQRARHLPGIVSSDVVWCQGFSEPAGGSDLAALQTRAVMDGDYFVVSGQKIWTTLAHEADWCALLVKTDTDVPKHKGISYLLADLRLPGIEIRPLIDITGRHTFNEVFFNDVRIPRGCLIGELNKGWYIAAATLDFERSGINRVVAGLRTYEELVEHVRGASGLQSVARNKLAELGIEFQIGRLLAYRVASMQARGEIPNAEASMSKTFGAELQQRLGVAGVQLMGLAGQLLPSGPTSNLARRIARYYLYAAGLTIAAGTSEVMRGIIAQRGLNLPRG